MSSCAFNGSPPLNADIAGTGVRIRRMFRRFSLVSCGASRSHHTQVRVVVVTTVSPSIKEIHSQALTFTVMNISVIAAALILGFSADPQISLQECVYFVTPTYAPLLINILITVPSSLGSSVFTIIPLIVIHIAGMKPRHRNNISNAMNSSDWGPIPATVSMSIMYALSAGFTLAVSAITKCSAATQNATALQNCSSLAHAMCRTCGSLAWRYSIIYYLLLCSSRRL